MADILNRLLLETKDFDAKLSNSKKGVNDYQGSITNMASTARTGILKFAGAFGVVMGAQEAFTKTIKASQTTSDEYDRVMRGVKSSVDSFFTAISTGDFTAFNQGLDKIIEKARAANNSIDQLGNTTISYGYFNTKNQAGFAEAIAVMRDSKAGEADKEAAKNTVDRIMGNQKEITGQLRRRADEAAQALVVEGNSLKAGNITRIDMDKMLFLDVSAMGDSEKEVLAKKYKEYTSVYNKIVRENTKTTMMQGAGGVTSQSITDYKAVEKAIESVNNEYQDAILYNEILVRKSDTWLKEFVGVLNTADNADRTFAGMQKTLNRTLGSKGNGGGNVAPPPPPPPVGSIAAINEEIAAKNKELINATTMQARIAVQTTINELEAKKINLQIATDKGIFAAEHGEDKFNVSNVRKDFSQYTDIDKQISVKRKELISTTTEEARSAVLNTINELEAKKFSIRVSLEEEIKNNTIDSKSQKNISEYMDIDSKISQQKTSLVNSTTEEARSAVQGTINELEARKINLSANIDIKSNMSSEIAGVLNNGSKDKDGKQITKGSKAFDPKSVKKIKSPISKKDVKTLDDYQEKLYNISSAMGSMAGVMGEGAASWLNWGSSLISAINQGIPAIKNLILALQGKACGEAIAGAAASGPWGWIEAGLAVASIVASFASIPAFANGGIIEGGSTFGDMNLARVNAGEMILNGNQQRNLFDLLNNGSNSSASKGGAVSFTIHGKDLKGVLSNYDNQKNKVR